MDPLSTNTPGFRGLTSLINERGINWLNTLLYCSPSAEFKITCFTCVAIGATQNLFCMAI